MAHGVEIGLRNVVEDVTPQWGGNLDVNGKSLVSVSDGNIAIAPNGTGVVTVSSDLQWPDSKGPALGDVQDYTIEWSGSNAVHTISAGTYDFVGGGVHIGVTGLALELGNGGSGGTYLQIGGTRTTIGSDGNAAHIQVSAGRSVRLNIGASFGATATTILDVSPNGTRLGSIAGNYAEFSTTGNLVFVGTAGMAFAEIWAHGITDAITSVAQNDWDQIVGFAVDGENNNATPDHTNDHITITKAGKYKLNFCWSGYGPATAHDWDLHVCRNNNDFCFDNVTAHVTTPSTQKIVAVMSTGYADLAATDTIELWVKRTSAGNNIVLTTVHCSISLLQVGGT